MARIALIGGHGKVARPLARLLAEAGHDVDAIIRNPDHREDVAATGATPVVADVEALETGEMTELLQGHDVVIWSAGAGGGSPERTYAVDRDAAIRSVDAAEAAGARRYLMLSYFGAGPDHGVPEDDPFHAYAEAKAAADERVRASDLAWTILAPSRLTDDEPTGGIEVDGPGVDRSEVPRADVAAVAAAVVERDDTVGRTVSFNGGSVPIADALGQV